MWWNKQFHNMSVKELPCQVMLNDKSLRNMQMIPLSQLKVNEMT